MKRIFFLLAALVFVTSVFGDGFIVVNDPHWRPGPRPPVWPGPIPPPRAYDFAPLEVSYHHVNVKIDGQIATTSVDEEFYNPNPQRLEGTYLFPIPKGAQIDKFTMDIGGQQIAAELLPADKARQIYEDIVRKMRDPALMEYADRDVFKVRIFPIEPNSRKRITLSYTQVLKAEAGLVSYVYPLNTEKFSAKPIKDVSVQVELSSDRPLKTIYSPSHAVEIKRHGSTRATVGFEASDALPDTDFALYFAPEKQVMPKDVAFVLDTSGSMAGKKLEQAKKALRFCVENLNDYDRFEIIRFSTEVEPLFDKLVTATESNREKANDFIKDLKPIGGTALDDALQKALALRPDGGRPFAVIFLTDGMPTIGTTDENQIVADAKKISGGRTRVFCFGIGGDVNTHLLDKITEETRAFSQYVLPEEDIEVKVSNFFSKIKDPVLANPTIKFTAGVRATKLYPSPLPDLFRGDQLVLAGRYSGEGNSAVILEGTVNGEKRQFTYEVNFPRSSDDNEFIPRLWATRRVGYLLDEIRLHGENAELRDEVTQLARQFNIVTPYTAYLIVEDEDRRRVPLAMQSLPQLYSDKDARREAVDNWNGFKNETGGEKALAGSRYGLALKNADVVSVATASGAMEANRALGFAGGGAGAMPATPPVPADDAKAKLANDSQQGQLVAGKNFFQNTSNQWVDSLAQQFQNAKRQRIQFNSSEYFDFAAKHSKALPWLALGQNVQFVLDDTLYDIYE
jgi:Ca-activated chloride channel family protein